jgi:chorismate synthase
MVEAMMALTLVDHIMMQKAQCELFPNEASQDERPNPIGVTARRDGGPRTHVDDVAVGVAAHDNGPISQRVDEE